MRISYKALFSVECLHDYFEDHVCAALTLRPTTGWERLRQRYQLLFRPSPGGGTVYYGDESGSDLRRLSLEMTPIPFTLTSTDPLFDIYTESGVSEDASPEKPSEPRPRERSVYYFSNRPGHPHDVYGQQRRLLHPPSTPVAQPPLPVRAGRFTYRFDQPVGAAALEALDAGGQAVWRPQTPPAPTSDERDWLIDLDGQPSARYQLTVDGRPVLDFLLSDAPAARQWGVVEVFLKEVVDILLKDGDPGPAFTVALTGRETTWRYYIFDQPQGSARYEGYEVVGVRKRSGGGDGSGNADIRFTRKAETVTLNGRPASVFESEQVIPLCEVPADGDYLFTYKANGRSDRGGLQVKLPFAQPAATKLEDAPGGPRMVSDIFVYL